MQPRAMRNFWEKSRNHTSDSRESGDILVKLVQDDDDRDSGRVRNDDCKIDVRAHWKPNSRKHRGFIPFYLSPLLQLITPPNE